MKSLRHGARQSPSPTDNVGLFAHSCQLHWVERSGARANIRVSLHFYRFELLQIDAMYSILANREHLCPDPVPVISSPLQARPPVYHCVFAPGRPALELFVPSYLSQSYRPREQAKSVRLARISV